ncbi:O-methyltransferase [Vibrio sp.]|uniref:O-methyltransferase n=1 Tax=Vibrio sp. TaxID=678 RepID=UPI003D1436D0
MKRIHHWSPRYISSRLRDKLYRKLNPHSPWLTPIAIDLIDQWLQSEDVGFEFGSGRSTIWFAMRIAFLTSVENNPDWYQRVQQWLDEANLENVEHFLRGEDDTTTDYKRASNYLSPVTDIPSEHLDFALVDGRWRSQCANALIPKLRPGGLMIIDNINLYLPSPSHAPNSRTLEEGPLTDGWKRFWNDTKTWRRIWTSNGVSDTALFFKPAS